MTLIYFNTFSSSMHTFQLWWNFNSNSIHKLRVWHNNVFRKLLRLSRYCTVSGMFAKGLISNCKVVIRNPVYKFKKRLDNSHISLIIFIVVRDVCWMSRFRSQWVIYVMSNTSLFIYFDIYNIPFAV